jgi:hypothetical protein
MMWPVVSVGLLLPLTLIALIALDWQRLGGPASASRPSPGG